MPTEEELVVWERTGIGIFEIGVRAGRTRGGHGARNVAPDVIFRVRVGKGRQQLGMRRHYMIAFHKRFLRHLPVAGRAQVSVAASKRQRCRRHHTLSIAGKDASQPLSTRVSPNHVLIDPSEVADVAPLLRGINATDIRPWVQSR